jgi:protein arginine kinase activator
MLCQECNKNKASVYYNENINGEKVEKYLCSECAKEYTNVDFDFNMPFSMMDVISKLGFQPEKEAESKLICPTCNSTYSDFKNTGRFGCSHCYEAFSSQINPMLQNIHGHLEHVGKAPKKSYHSISVKNEVKKIKEELDRAVKTEDYEEAAKLRDKIKALEDSID